MSGNDRILKIQWRLLQMLAEHRFKKNTDIAQRLRQLNLEISTRLEGRSGTTNPAPTRH